MIGRAAFCLAALIAAPTQAQNLSAANVDRILSQAVVEAGTRGFTVTVAVVDRVGNVLGVYRTGPAVNVTITSNRGIAAGNGLEAVAVIPSPLAVIAKAITGAYLSSAGNAFTTRTASQIVLEHFNPGEFGQPGGPLFGVQFSQLPCSDLLAAGAALGIGPRRSPLGLAADPGGLPLYIGGQVVGGVGVIADGIYSLDLEISDYDRDVDEFIAVAAQSGFAPTDEIKAQRIAVDGRLLRYADVDGRHLASDPAVAPAVPVGGAFVAVAGYFTAGASRAGQIFGTAASGIRADGGANFPGLDAFVLDTGAGMNRYPPTASPDAGGLTADEVRTIIAEALRVAFRGRAQIRRPLASFVQVTVSVVDTQSRILGLARTPDAPIFGTDVSLQKARSAVFFSRVTTAAELQALAGTPIAPLNVAFPDYVSSARSYLGPGALADGIAFADRSIGNLARPYYPDGIVGSGAGPFSRPRAVWSPFNTGLQLDLVQNDIVAKLDGSLHPASGCTQLPQATGAGPRRLANGLQIFPGSVPIYRGDVLVGGVGVSGDGIDQDDMVAFLGLHNAGISLGNSVGNAPLGVRADTRVVGGVNLRYVNCPFAPFNNSREQNVCRGK